MRPNTGRGASLLLPAARLACGVLDCEAEASTSGAPVASAGERTGAPIRVAPKTRASRCIILTELGPKIHYNMRSLRRACRIQKLAHRPVGPRNLRSVSAGHSRATAAKAFMTWARLPRHIEVEAAQQALGPRLQHAAPQNGIFVVLLRQSLYRCKLPRRR